MVDVDPERSPQIVGAAEQACRKVHPTRWEFRTGTLDYPCDQCLLTVSHAVPALLAPAYALVEEIDGHSRYESGAVEYRSESGWRDVSDALREVLDGIGGADD